MSKTALRFMGEGEPETFRCRVYGADEPDKRLRFLQQLAAEGALDAPAYDRWIAALNERGWLTSSLEAVPEGRVKRWRLNETGRAALARVEGLR